MPKEHKMSKAEKEYNDYIKNCPDWYWVHGLHDAEILEANELKLPPDWKSDKSKWNCLELVLDAKGARESNVRKILLYNYKILSGNISNLKEKKVWWMGDTISYENDKYILNIEFENTNGEKFALKIEFEIAETKRKQ